MTDTNKKLLVFDFSGTLETSGKLYEGIADMLKQLHDSEDYHMVILSRASRSSIQDILAEESERLYPRGDVNLETYFEAIYDMDDIIQANHGSPDKSDPRVLRSVVQDLADREIEIEREEAVVVGDTSAEHLMGKRCGIGFVYAGWHDPKRGKASKSGLDEIYATPDSGHVAITREDISQAVAPESPLELPAKLQAMFKQRNAPFMRPDAAPER